MDKKNKNNVAKILLAFGVLASPMMLANQVSADNSIGNTTDTHNANTKNTNNVDATATAQPDAVTTYNVLNENKEEKEVVTTAAEKNKAEATEEATSTVNTATDETETTTKAEEKSDENKEIVENKEEVDFKLDASQRHELKEAGYTDEEIEGIENYIKHSLTEDSKFNVHDYITSKINDKKVETENPSLEISNDEKESVQAGEEKEAGRDISNDITEAEIHVGETNETGTLRADIGENLKWEVRFKAPNNTKAGDYFDIKLSDNWTLKGIEPDTNYAEPIKIGETTIAVGKRIDRHHIRYTFTEDIDGLDDIQVNVQYGGYDDKEKIKYSSDQKFEIGVGDNKDEKDLYVNYGSPFYDQFGTTINGRSQYTSWNPETGEFTQVFYINPDSKFISSSNEDFLNNNVGVYINNRDYDDKETQVKFTAENTTVDIVKLPSRTRIPDAVYENPVEGETDNSVTTTFDTNGITVNLNKNSIDNPYIITLRSRINPNVEQINLGSRGYVYGNGTNHYLGMTNVIRYETGNTGGSGVEETHALGDRVWIDDNKDGLQTEGEKGVEGVTVKLTGEG
ncbi:Ig-like domain-containing protein, partial [Finegoldia magna]|uniref:Ig-like domain-containing protein n=1 Tax=Finegoldia magna TaxID=1260 RepID=UPI0029049C78